MPKPDQESLTLLLNAAQRGEEAAVNKLFSRVYDELYRLAQSRRKNWIGGDYTMNTTALVHEAYLKLSAQEDQNWNSRNHFMGIAAKAMRHILINYAEKRRAKKRGGDVKKVSIEDQPYPIDAAIPMTDDQADKIVAIEQALQKLAEQNPRQVQIIECKFFAGMSNQETADALGTSVSTVKRDWAVAQAWLYREAKEAIE